MKKDSTVEEIVCMTYEQWEEKHRQEARCEARIRQRRWNKKHEADRERRRYFCNQKFIGLLITVGSFVPYLFSRLAVTLLLGAMVAGLGLAMVLTDKMVIVNDYWWENGGADQWK